MARIAWRGKNYRHVSVGKDKMYDYQDLQNAWDSIGDSDEDNPYLISVDAGEWQYQATGGAAAAPGWLLAGKTDIAVVGVSAEQCRFRRIQSTGDDNGGGCVQVGTDSGDATERVLVEGLQFVNELSGTANNGDPPEGALYIGEEETPATTLTWNDITVRGCVVEGVHDALQVFGFVAPGDSGPATPGLLHVQGNIIKSVHDAYTVKGAVRLHSSSNQIYVDSGGIEPYLGTVEAWKHTGIHYNSWYGITSATDRGDEHYSIHTGEQIRMFCDGNTGGTGQEVFAGLYLYSSALLTNLPGYRIKMHGCSIDMVHDADDTPTNGVAGVLVRNKQNIPDGYLELSGVSIYLHQRNAGENAPDTASGVLMSTNHATGSAQLFISNSRIRVQNDKVGSNAYRLATTNAQDTIKHEYISSEQTDSEGSGNIVPVNEPVIHDGDIVTYSDEIVTTTN